MRITSAIESLLRWALLEDLPNGDVTTDGCLPSDVPAVGRLLAKSDLVLSGSEPASLVFKLVDPSLELTWQHQDGAHVSVGAELGRVSGSARTILAGERTALNLMQRLCGIATYTRRLVALVEGSGASVLDTRKTTPGWRLLEKQAVRAGGGRNHRFSLSDAVLIKTNHIRLVGSVGEAVRRARAYAAHLSRIEVEAHDLDSLEAALEAGADVVLLDNMSVELVTEAVRRTAGRARLEVSGGLSEDTIADYARTGVDFLSVGALTHSAPASDISLRLEAGAA